MENVKRAAQMLAKWRDWPFVLAFLLLIRFAYRAFEVSSSFPNLFEPQTAFFAPESAFPGFAALIVAVALLLAVSWYRGRRDKPSRFVGFFQHNWRGFLLGLVFFLIYFVLANALNPRDFNTNNVYFAADTNSWKVRIATDDGYLMGMRGIHPLAMLIIRPAVYAVAFLFNADVFHAAIMLLALTGAASIALAWAFIRNSVGDENYAFLFGAIFGLSTAHLLFNSLMETYIFSASFLVLFFYLLQKQAHFVWLILIGVGTFGITISNLVQNSIGLLLVDLKIRRALLLVGAVLVAAFALTFVNRALHPNSDFFFAGGPQGELQHYIDVTFETGILPRARLAAANMFMFSVVAPQPFLDDAPRDDDSRFPRFNFMLGPRLSQFVGTGRIAIVVWLAIFAGALVSFVQLLRREGLSVPNRFALAFLACLAFNLVFHAVYAFDPFLYSADWTYALVLFTAIVLRALAANTWLQIALLALIALLTLNNLFFLNFLMTGLSPFVLGP
ncbi:MAG: hypothetical protein WEC37_00865 [Anaerolineales bacterium]